MNFDISWLLLAQRGAPRSNLTSGFDLYGYSEGTSDVRTRSELLLKVAAQLRSSKSEYAKLITIEMGKSIAEAEAEKSAVTCEFYAAERPRFLADESVASSASASRVVFDPLGMVLAIMPWNYPFWQLVRFAAPTLAAGNAALLKHASNVPGCAPAHGIL